MNGKTPSALSQPFLFILSFTLLPRVKVEPISAKTCKIYQLSAGGLHSQCPACLRYVLLYILKVAQVEK